MANNNVKPLIIALGAALGTAGAVSTAAADQNPFSLTELTSGYMVSGAEGRCGEGKCGEGKCGGDKHAEGKCGEGKCGEGKCGGTKGKMFSH